jgi:RNA polymerase sigma-70 factor (ECF subfamily)
MPNAYGTRASLIARLQGSDPAGWERLVGLYRPLLWHWARQSGVKPQDVDDICQEVFKVVTVRIGSFELNAHHGSFRAWLRSITRNVCRERERKVGVEGYAAGGTAAGVILSEVVGHVLEDQDPADLVSDLIRQAVVLVRGEFSDAHWLVFERLTFDGLSPSEVAVEKGLTAANVRAIKSRIRRRLHEELGDVLEPAVCSPVS